MTVEFRDLPAIAFQPASQSLPARGPAESWEAVCLGLGGEVFLSLFEEGKGSRFLSETGEELPLKQPGGGHFSLAYVQRFTDGAFLVVESRTSAGTPNAAVFRPDGTFSHAFYAGDGIQNVLVDPLDRIWVGYFDEGVVNGLLSKGKDPGRNGLVRFDRQGGIEFAFNEALTESEAGRFIDDIYALTVDQRGRAWFSPYTGFYLGRVEGKDITYVLEQSPAAGAESLLVGVHHVAFYGGYDQPSLIQVVELKSRRLRLVQLRDAAGEPLSFQRVAARAQQLAGVAGDSLYKLDLDTLLERLGPWDDGNCSTVDSALAYAASQESGELLLILKDDLRDIQEE